MDVLTIILRRYHHEKITVNLAWFDAVAELPLL